MTTPTVTELPRVLEPVTRDPFIDRPGDEASAEAGAEPLAAPSRSLAGRGSDGRASGGGENEWRRAR